MSNQWIAPESCPSLAVLVETVTAPLLIQHASPVCLEMAIESGFEIPADPKQTAELIRALVTQMLSEMPNGGELAITASQDAGGIVLELADNGCRVEERACSMPMVAAAIGANLDWQNRSQGGTVVKVTFGQRGQATRQAA